MLTFLGKCIDVFYVPYLSRAPGIIYSNPRRSRVLPLTVCILPLGQVPKHKDICGAQCGALY